MSDITADVRNAKAPEDLYGPLDTPVPRAKRVWRKIAAVLHPDRGGDTALYQKASEYWELWNDAVSSGASKAKTTTNPNTPTLLARGTWGNVFDYNGVALKVSRTPEGDAKVKAEYSTIKKIIEFLHGGDNEKVMIYFPIIHDQMRVNGRAAFTMDLNEGFYTLTEISEYFPGGIPGRHLAWIFRRVIFALRAMEDAGVRHGNINSDNIMIHPEQHGVRLVGLTSTRETGTIIDDVRDAGDTFASLSEAGSREYKYFDGLSRFPVEPKRLQGEYDRFIERLYGPRRFVKMELERV